MKTIQNAILALIAAVALATPAWSLDVKDLILMVQNDVEEQVIVNMVRSNRLPAPLTTSDVILLNSSGASTQLMEFLTSPEAATATAGGTVVYDPPVTYVEPPTTIIESPTTIIESPTYVETPTYIYTEPYYYDDYRYNYGYTYPWYGGGWGGPSYRPRPPSHRPPPPPPSRPGRPGGPSRPGGGRPGVGRPEGGRPGGGRPGGRPEGGRPGGGERPPKPPEGGGGRPGRR